MPELQVHRHEEKYLLNAGQAALLRGALDGLLRRDAHSAAGPYFIRSLYFDTPDDRDYTDKLLGLPERTKLRLRLYDTAAETCKLEIKAKAGRYSHKRSVTVSRAQARALLDGGDPALPDTPAARQALLMLRSEHRRPAALVDYRRTAWLLPVERVRITLDEGVRAAKSSRLFDPALPTVGLHGPGTVILEVKYDHYLPGYLRGVLSAAGGQAMSISKYAAARAALY